MDEGRLTESDSEAGILREDQNQSPDEIRFDCRLCPGMSYRSHFRRGRRAGRPAAVHRIECGTREKMADDHSLERSHARRGYMERRQEQDYSSD
mgnify:CR=1 FL=1